MRSLKKRIRKETPKSPKAVSKPQTKGKKPPAATGEPPPTKDEEPPPEPVSADTPLGESLLLIEADSG